MTVVVGPEVTPDPAPRPGDLSRVAMRRAVQVGVDVAPGDHRGHLGYGRRIEQRGQEYGFIQVALNLGRQPDCQDRLAKLAGQGAFGPLLFGSVILLFMVVPIMLYVFFVTLVRKNWKEHDDEAMTLEEIQGVLEELGSRLVIGKLASSSPATALSDSSAAATVEPSDRRPNNSSP